MKHINSIINFIGILLVFSMLIQSAYGYELKVEKRQNRAITPVWLKLDGNVVISASTPGEITTDEFAEDFVPAPANFDTLKVDLTNRIDPSSVLVKVPIALSLRINVDFSNMQWQDYGTKFTHNVLIRMGVRGLSDDGFSKAEGTALVWSEEPVLENGELVSMTLNFEEISFELESAIYDALLSNEDLWDPLRSEEYFSQTVKEFVKNNSIQIKRVFTYNPVLDMKFSKSKRIMSYPDGRDIEIPIFKASTLAFSPDYSLSLKFDTEFQTKESILR